MIRNKATKKQGVRRLAPFLAALGMLVMSSGAALMVTAAPANAANKVGVCHATNSDSNPYNFISVDDDSVKLKGHLQHKTAPNKIWKTAGFFNGQPHAANDPKPDLIGSFTDDQGVFHQYDGNITAASCENTVQVIEATADVDFENPSCANKNVVSYDTVGSHVTFSILSGSATPGSNIVVRATADPGTQFDGGATTQDFPHAYPAAVDLAAPPCVTADAGANVEFTDPTCANQSTASYNTDGDHVTFAITNGSVGAGNDIQVTATADAGHTFGDLTTKKVFTYHFGNAVNLNGPPCVIVAPPGVALAAVDFVDPSCGNLNDAAYTPSGDNATFAVTSGSAAPGAEIEITATAALNHLFAGDALTKVFTHTYGAAVDLEAEPCVSVVPPEDTPEITPTATVATPTLVHAGLVSATPDLRGEQGLALLVAGMILMVAAGALGLIRPGAKARG